MAEPRSDLEVLDTITDESSEEEVQDILFIGLSGDLSEDGHLILHRLRNYRAARPSDQVSKSARIIYESLVSIGEEKGDMDLVHFAVDCRDALTD